MQRLLIRMLIAALAWAGADLSAIALDAPKNKPILTISGNISVTNKDKTAEFDREMLETLGMVTVETTMPWHEGTAKFEGVPLNKLMQYVGASGERVNVVALNDYSTEIPMEDFAKHQVILALKRNGEYMPIRDKGPLFVVYPFDSKPELKSQTYYARSAWQVAKIIVR